jgi:hypothetical protein
MARHCEQSEAISVKSGFPNVLEIALSGKALLAMTDIYF